MSEGRSGGVAAELRISDRYNWDLMDWAHLTALERRHVRVLLARRAYLLTQPGRHGRVRSYAADEVQAIDWALGLAVDRTAAVPREG